MRLDEVAVGSAGTNEAAPKALRITLQLDGEQFTDCWFHVRNHEIQNWRIGEFEFTGRCIYWREAADGRVLYATSHADAFLLDTRHGRKFPFTLELSKPLSAEPSHA